MRGGEQGGKAAIGSRMSQWLLDCLFPKYCLECRREGSYWCPDCKSRPRAEYALQCFGCRGRSALTRLCEDCAPNFAFVGLVIASDYENEPIGTMVRLCKCRFVRELAGELSEQLRPALMRLLNDEAPNSALLKDFFQAKLCPIPLSARRRRWRGFNQAELLAEGLKTYFGLEGIDLLRRSHRPPQAKLSEAQRRTNLKDSFEAVGVPPKFVLLVDDVVTTGATLNEAARTLKNAGAQEVWAVVAAKG